MAEPKNLLLSCFVGLSLLSLSACSWAQPLARLESPSPLSFTESGVGLIRGWACDARRVEISINDRPRQAVAHGTRRADTLEVCGHPDTGFGLTFNWNALGEGVHRLRAFADDVEFADVNFTVATLGADFLTGLQGEYVLPDFPVAGDTARIRWSEPHQNFVFVRPMIVPNAPPVPNNQRAALEAPHQGSFESGVGLIRGWACDARRVEISINDGPRQAVAHGTRRADTLEVCGHPDTGFGLTFNWNALGEGVHRLRAFADDVEFADVNFAVATLGADFLTGLNRKYTLGDFPDAGETTEVRWSEPHQNFVISRSTASPASAARGLVLVLINSPENWFTGIFAEWNADMAGDEGAGPAVTKDSMGQPTQFHALTWTAAKGSTGVELLLADNGLPVTYRDGSGIEGRLSGFTENSVTVDFYRHGQPVAEPVTTPIDSGLLQNLQAFINRWQSQSAVHQSDAPHNWMERSSSRILLVNLLFVSAVVNAETNCAVQNAADRVGLLGQISARLACLSPLNQRLLGLHQNRGLANSQFGYADFVVQQTPSVGQEISIDGPACDPSDSYTACLAKTISTAQEELDQRRSQSSNKSNKLSPLVSVLDELVIHQFDPTLTD